MGVDDEHLMFFSTGYDPKTRQKLGTLASAFYDARELGPDVMVDYADLEEQDILPLFGYLYRVSGIIGDRSIGFQWVGNHFRQGITFEPGSFPIPLCRKKLAYTFGMARLHDTDVFVEKIERREQRDKGAAVAEIRLVPFRRPGSVETVHVRPGDVLTIGKAAHKVRNVVPRDPKLHVIGWVELDPKPMEPAGAKAL
jgi:hypothetical protein